MHQPYNNHRGAIPVNSWQTIKKMIKVGVISEYCVNSMVTALNKTGYLPISTHCTLAPCSGCSSFLLTYQWHSFIDISCTNSGGLILLHSLHHCSPTAMGSYRLLHVPIKYLHLVYKLGYPTLLMSCSGLMLFHLLYKLRARPVELITPLHSCNGLKYSGTSL